MSHKILVVGSTGTIGHHLVKSLSEAGEQVRAATTAPEKLMPLAGVDPVRLDLRDANTYTAALEEIDRIFLLGPTGYMDPYELLAPFIQQALIDQPRKFVLQTASGVETNDAIPLRRVELLLEKSGGSLYHFASQLVLR